jgi:hypothetical protein
VAKTKASVSVGDLVRAALLKVAEAGEVKLTGKADGLFASAAGANKQAIAECRDGEQPLLAVVRKEGKSEIVALTPAGFERIASEIPEENLGAVAKHVASVIPAASRIDFIQDTLSRTPLAAAELTPLLEEAVAAEKAEQEVRVAAAAKRRAAEVAAQEALERAKQLIEQRQQNRLTALRREWEAEGQKASELPAPAQPAAKPASAGERGSAAAPRTPEETDFRRDVANQLASAWAATWETNKPDAREFLESAMWNINGLRLIGEAGQRTAFSGRYHDSVPGVFSGDEVRVVRPGWALDEEKGEFVVLKALVAK